MPPRQVLKIPTQTNAVTEQQTELAQNHLLQQQNYVSITNTSGQARRLCEQMYLLNCEQQVEPAQSHASHHPNYVKNNESGVTPDTCTGFKSMCASR